MNPIIIPAAEFENIKVERISALLSEHGAAVVRGGEFTVATLELLTRRLFRQFHQPATRADLRWATGDGYSSKVRKDTRLLAHAEAYYRPCISPPDVCVFFCEKAPQVSGGETFIIDGNELYNALPSDMAHRLETEGIIYESFWSRERWQAEFHTSDVNVLRDMLDRDGRCQYELLQDDELHLFFKTQPILYDQLGRKYFINGMLAHLHQVDHSRYENVPIFTRPSNRVYWGGGRLVDNTDICRLIDAHDTVMYKHRWLDGDVLLIDNHFVLHGREWMESPGERIIYSRFGYLISESFVESNKKFEFEGDAS